MEIKREARTTDEIKVKLNDCRTLYNKIALLEGLTGRDLDIVAKKFVYTQLVELYLSKGMYDKAAKAMRGKAGLNTLYRELVEDYVKAGEYYIKAGRIQEGDDMFNRALAEASGEQVARIKMTMKNVLFATAKEFEAKKRTSAAIPFYDKVLRLSSLTPIEKTEVKGKLMGIYKSFGMFRELKLLEGI
jgi:tetratricopeptide (TPR) repeat protein